MRNKLILLSLLTLPLSGMAATSITATVSGTLYIPMSCDLGANRTVPFGNISSADITNGTAAAQSLNVTMTCTNWNTIQRANIKVTGTGTTTNKLPITGNAKGFVLALKRNGTAVNFNTDIPITAVGAVGLTLTPENKTTEAFVAGTFSAVATIAVTVT
ncbi:fimbrial protein [Serratia proteamaculans]|uniref:fimbrial protein n=1 Tax=Serratia proteamaculans TaxID=28151 RepID=UPI0039AEB5AB